MKKNDYLARLGQALADAPDRAEILGDISEHFDTGLAAGRKEEDIATALGQPEKLALEYRGVEQPQHEKAKAAESEEPRLTVALKSIAQALSQALGKPGALAAGIAAGLVAAIVLFGIVAMGLSAAFKVLSGLVFLIKGEMLLVEALLRMLGNFGLLAISASLTLFILAFVKAAGRKAADYSKSHASPRGSKGDKEYSHDQAR